MVRFGPQDPSGPWAGREIQRADLGAERQAERSGRSAGLGREALKGPAGSTVRAGQSGPKALEGRMEALDGLFPSTGRSPERRRQCYSEKGNNGNKTGLIPTASRALGVTKSVLPKGEMVTA